MKLYGLCYYRKKYYGKFIDNTLIIKKVSYNPKDLKTSNYGEFIDDVSNYCTIKGKYAYYKTNPFKKYLKITGI